MPDQVDLAKALSARITLIPWKFPLLSMTGRTREAGWCWTHCG